MAQSFRVIAASAVAEAVDPQLRERYDMSQRMVTPMEPLEITRVILMVLVVGTVSVVGTAWYLIRSLAIAERNGHSLDSWSLFPDPFAVSSEKCQLFDYFACRRALMEKWAEAVASGQERLREDLEAEMPRVITLKNLGPDEVRILAQCAAGGDVDLGKAIDAVIEQKGCHALSFRQSMIESIAAVQVDESLLQRWAKHVSKLNAQTEAENRRVLTYGAARRLKDLCTFAVNEHLGVFTCSYG